MIPQEDLSLRATLYDATHRGHEGDLAFYTAHCPPGTDVLELGCGSGRILEALTSRAGRTVGLDMDASLLRIARDSLPDEVEFFLGDMLAFRSQDRFDRILLPFNGIYCLGGPGELDRLFATITHHLRADGEFLVDLYDTAELEADALEFSDPVLEDEADHILDILVDDETFHVFESTRWFPRERRFEVTFRYESDNPLRLPIEMIIDHDYFPVGTLLEAARRNGLEVVEHLIGFPGTDEDDEAPHVFRFRRARLQI